MRSRCVRCETMQTQIMVPVVQHALFGVAVAKAFEAMAA